MRVLIVINQLQDHGGAEVSTIDILREAHGDGFEFLAVTLLGDADFAGRDALAASGVEFRTAPSSFLSRLRFLASVMRSWRPDLVHATLFEADLAVRLVAPLCRVPVLSSLVNTEYSAEAVRNAPSPFKLKIARLINMFSGWFGVSHFHAISVATAAHGQQRLLIPTQKITVVPRGRDPQRLGRWSADRRASARAALGLLDGQTMILNVARREPQKGQLHLVRALHRLHGSGLDEAVLFVAGRDGNASSELNLCVSELGLEDSVHFLGTRDDVADLLCACDVFAFSSLWEGLGGALVEALALEAPIVAFDIDAAREVVGECGLLVPVGDAGALAEGILEAVKDPAASRQRATAGRKRFEEMYSVRAMRDGMRGLYRKVSDLPAPPVLRSR